MSYFLRKTMKKIFMNVISAAVVIGALRVKCYCKIYRISCLLSGDCPKYAGGMVVSAEHYLSSYFLSQY